MFRFLKAYPISTLVVQGFLSFRIKEGGITMSRKTIFCFLFSLLLACSLGASVLAQGIELGSIEGTVTDKSGAVVPGVSITVKNKATGFERVVVSDDSGYYRVPGLQPGNYTLTAELSGFSKLVVEEAIVNVGTSTN